LSGSLWKKDQLKGGTYVLPSKAITIKNINKLFLVLILVQGAHSSEEYMGRLWENFPPATYLTGVISENPETGFLIANIGLFVFGIICWFILVSGSSLFARPIIWFWIVLETINGLGHPIWSLIQGAYTPGVATAFILLLLSILIYRQLKRLHAAGQ